jgi:cobalt-precorrin-5B (C1)-methyltransferase
LSELARQSGASAELVQRVSAANTARHVQELAQGAGLQQFFPTVAQEVAARSFKYVNGGLSVDALLFDFDGTLLGRGRAG